MTKVAHTTRVQFRLNPRVFAALGADLVTNDFVAITELVKNSYDAFADHVDVSFVSDPERGSYIELVDNGSGMSREILDDVWSVVATPYRAEVQYVRKGSKSRRVAGEKGLGRLAMARLGDKLEMVTQAKGETPLLVKVTWSELYAAKDINRCFITIEEVNESPFQRSGTRIRIYDLFSEWGDEQLDELHEHLSRLLSPFNPAEDFEIWLRRPGFDAIPAKVETPKFLQHPKYKISGIVDDAGTVRWTYVYKPIDASKVERRKSQTTSWDAIKDRSKSQRMKDLATPGCGPFTFEVRAWDVTLDDTSEISDKFNIKKGMVRSTIRAHKGLSVYRDDILVLPKSESARDWLGMDIRRVSELGTRLSTSQIIGYVSISAESNPLIKDTSDRERLVDSVEVAAFQTLIKSIVEALEQERQADRLDNKKAEAPLRDLFAGLSTDELLDEVSTIVEDEGSANQVVPLIKRFGKTLSQTKAEIERRFVYYSRLATIGTLAQMLVHEVRNKTTVIGNLLRDLRDADVLKTLGDVIRPKVERATTATEGLDRLADTFSPLASRSFARGRRTSKLEERINGVLALREADFKKHGIAAKFAARGETQVSIDPGELDAVLLNLVDNALFWLSQAETDERVLEVRLHRFKNGSRVRVGIHDSGPGVPEDYAERIFWPGVTTKPGGIGMGLTIAGEIVDAHDGELTLQQPGEYDGASFVFDLPVKSS